MIDVNDGAIKVSIPDVLYHFVHLATHEDVADLIVKAVLESDDPKELAKILIKYLQENILQEG